jgi:hypothetical protein
MGYTFAERSANSFERVSIRIDAARTKFLPVFESLKDHGFIQNFIPPSFRTF